jgi:hypothetical protein
VLVAFKRSGEAMRSAAFGVPTAYIEITPAPLP